MNEMSNMLSQSFDLGSQSGFMRLHDASSEVGNINRGKNNPINSSINFMRKTQSTFKKPMGDTIHSTAFVDRSPLIDDIMLPNQSKQYFHHTNSKTIETINPKDDLKSEVGFKMSNVPKSVLHQSVDVNKSLSGLTMVQPKRMSREEREKLNRTIMIENEGRMSKPYFKKEELS